MHGERFVFISSWFGAMIVIFGAFILIGVVQTAGYGGRSIGSRLCGVGIILLAAPFAVSDLTRRILIADAEGFHELLRKHVRWTSVQWAEISDFVPGLIPNVTVCVVAKDVDPKTGRLREYFLPGPAGFTEGKRHRQIVTQFNDWIAAADPDWVINPWLHRSDRPDNR